MTDAEIRKAFHRQCLKKYHSCPQTSVIEELGILNGNVRADVVLVNGALIGFEIKSHKDDLSRISRQIQGYDAVFDKSAVVAAPKFIEKLWNLLPSHWGIIEAQINADIFYFHAIRSPNTNPYIDPTSLARLLWKDEMIFLLESMSISISGKSSRKDLCQLISETCSLTKLRHFVRQKLQSRKGLSDHKSPFQCGDLSQSIST